VNAATEDRPAGEYIFQHLELRRALERNSASPCTVVDICFQVVQSTSRTPPELRVTRT
jgi:hypothetical protein